MSDPSNRSSHGCKIYTKSKQQFEELDDSLKFSDEEELSEKFSEEELSLKFSLDDDDSLKFSDEDELSLNCSDEELDSKAHSKHDANVPSISLGSELITFVVS
jgi:hypothetical protein